MYYILMIDSLEINLKMNFLYEMKKKYLFELNFKKSNVY